ncbi:MAG TPA: PASTA domain-containing protein [Terriglobales bacterium]|nr:PASTA domain-containing protein [Terriglobales bacterium]
MKSFFKLAMLVLVLLMVALVSALTAMRLAIHGHEVVVPKLVGMTPVEAERAVVASGLRVDVERQYYSPTVPEGSIVSQVPAPGTKVRRGWQVRVAQSLGPQRIAIPDVTGQTSRAAEINIQRRGLDIGATAIIRIPNAPADQVLSQTPPPKASGVSAPRISLLITAAPDQPAYVMPNFVGQPLGSVTSILQDAGMRVGTVTVTTAGQTPTDQPSLTPAPAPTPSPASLIVSQNPAAGQKISAGSAVNFEVSR